MAEHIESVAASELVEDFDLYPRSSVDSYNTKLLTMALENGDTLPPIHADRKTKRISDGFHTRRAHVRFAKNDQNVMVPVVWHDYKSSADILLDSIRRNAKHGKKLDMHDRMHCTQLARDQNVSMMAIAAAMGMRADALRAMYKARIVNVVQKDNGNEKVVDRVPIKAGLRHMEKLTQEQAEVNKHHSGAAPVRIMNELLQLLEHDMLPTDDDRIVEKAQKLVAALGMWLKWKEREKK